MQNVKLVPRVSMKILGDRGFWPVGARLSGVAVETMYGQMGVDSGTVPATPASCCAA